MDVAVVILNYNGRNWFEKFLPTVLKYSNEAEVIIVDNASTDDSVEYLSQHFPNVRLIINESNSGYAGGYNEGLAQIKAKYYVLLNSDIEVTENWLNPIIELMDGDDTIAAVQPKVLAYHDKERFEHAGAAGGMIDKLYYPFCKGRVFDNTEIDKGQYNGTHEVFWATGAVLFVRSCVYWELEGLDKDFFAHMEEIDLCWRIQNSGYKIMVCTDSTVYHVGGGTLNYNSPNKTYLNFRNNLYMIHKNHYGFLPGIIFTRLVLDGIAGVQFFLKGQLKHTMAVIKAHFAYYAQLGKLNKKRKGIQRRKLSSLNGLYPKSIVIQYFLRKKTTYTQLINK